MSETNCNDDQQQRVVMRNFTKRLKNANAVIKQLNAGEWDFKYNPMCKKCCTAYRDGNELWVGNGPWFCDVNESNAFGLLLRHYVWWMAAASATRRANRMHKKKIPTLYDA